MATTGVLPALARPPAKATACCSQMPTSWYWSGQAAASLRRPVPSGMAAVTPTTLGSRLASSMSASANTSV